MQTDATRIPWLAIIVIACGAFAAGIGLSWVQGRDKAAIDGLMWPDPPRLEALDLVDQDGRPFDLSRLQGHWSLVFFGFTHCPDVCPTTLDVLARSAQALKTHAHFGTTGQVLFVSLDPERDTPAVIANYVHYFAPDMLGATGTPEALKTLARTLGVLFMKVDQGDGAYSIDHSAGVFYIDPQARLVSVLTPPHTVAGVTARFDAVSNFIEAQ